jgi:predicted dehydrogenase
MPVSATVYAPLGIVVIGAGLIGRQHVARVRAGAGMTLRGIVDPTPEARAFAEEQGARWFPDIDAMLAAGRPDGAIVATPNQLHSAHALALIGAGVPTLIEKPLADTLEAGEAIVAAAAKAGVPVAVGHHRRHNPLVRRAKALIDHGRLGRIVCVHGFFWLMKPDAYFDQAWRREEGAGPLLINLIHDIDLMRHLVGDVEAVQAFRSNSVRNFAADETGVVNMRFVNGALGTFTVSDTVVAPWSWEHTTGENPVYPKTDQACYHIGGTLGSLSFPGLELWSNPGERSWIEPFAAARSFTPHVDALAEQLAQFAKAIRGIEEPVVSAAEGLEALKTIDAIRRAAASERTEQVMQARPTPDGKDRQLAEETCA